MGGTGEYRGVAFAATCSSAAPKRLIQSASSKPACVTRFSSSGRGGVICAAARLSAEDADRLLDRDFTGSRHLFFAGTSRLRV